MIKRFHNLKTTRFDACDNCGHPIADPAEMLCPDCKAKPKYPVEIHCAWCRKVIKIADFMADYPGLISHGACDKCYAEKIKELDESEVKP